jgi:hypothetical protein
MSAPLRDRGLKRHAGENEVVATAVLAHCHGCSPDQVLREEDRLACDLAIGGCR